MKPRLRDVVDYALLLMALAAVALAVLFLREVFGA